MEIRPDDDQIDRDRRQGAEAPIDLPEDEEGIIRRESAGAEDDRPSPTLARLDTDVSPNQHDIMHPRPRRK